MTRAAGHPSHSHAADAPASRLALALALISSFMVIEVSVGVLAHSLALISDAAHMLTDAVALAVSLVALRLAARPARGVMTYGLRRVEVLSAQANGVTLLVLAAVIVYSATGRLIHQPHVSPWPMVAVALAGILVNGLATVTLAGAGERSMSLEGSFQHVLTDLFAFIGTAAAGLVIALTGFQRADPIASLVVAALMGRSSYRLLRDSARVFLEAAPVGLDPREVGRALAGEGGVVEVHDLHIWELAPGFAALSAHVLVGAEDDCHVVRRRLETLLAERFGLHHTTLQADHEGDSGLIQLRAPGRPPSESG